MTVDNFQKTRSEQGGHFWAWSVARAARNVRCFCPHSCLQLFEAGLPCWRKSS